MSKEIKIDESLWIPFSERDGYEVNCRGLIRSIDKTVTTKAGWAIRKKGAILTPIDNGHGYLYVNFARNQRAEYVHRVIAKVFIPNPENLPAVNHKDLNKSNNHYKNLEWISHSNNSKHAFVNGRCSLPKDSKGAKNGNSKLTSDDVISIRALQGKRTAMEIATQFGITRSYVNNIFKRVKWGHLK